MRVRLRHGTADLHAGLDALFPHGLDDRATYRRYLLGMHRFATDYEAVAGIPPRHSAWLARDLAALSWVPPAAAQPRRAPADPATRLGWRYVMAGSAIGARRLVRDAAALGYDGSHGAAFLHAHARSDDWPRLLAELENAAYAPESAQADRIVAGAREAFTRAYACMRHAFDRVPHTPFPHKAIA